jgi:hypothetical protein
MMPITHAALSGLDACFENVLELTAEADRFLHEPESAEAIREEFATCGFVKVPAILPAEAHTALMAALWPILSPIAEQVTLLHVPRPEHALSDGARFWRVDPYCFRHPVIREKMSDLLGKLGLVEFGSLLAEKLTPLIRYVAGPLTFRRVYFYLYKEGDYISVHDDHHVGQRVDVQFPLTLGACAGIRVLSDGFLKMHYDSAGAMNILGPCVWHDVPPLTRGVAGIVPQRFNIGFRFTPDDASTEAER